MKLFDIFRKLKSKKVPEKMLETARTPLPSDLERFKIKREPLPVPISPYQASAQQLPPRPGLPPIQAPESKPTQVLDKEDMILQKLETIDARLRLIEERIK